ncbi:hypothetical protein [Pseudolactococcus raffinolactis]|jgi:hypothetical protein|uniref:hypothetical protein n=1 Tax=Pseudolactococcus raffinolactis TaxID=1366 RepID=UPI00143699AE|nr:hypothetical protein [Lactococcus raffinolactis]QIW50626.1 hypothetical protein GU337_01420 [Lactococcus raffinolactis]
MTSKQSALWGNIIASLTFVITAFRTLILALFASDIIANTAFVKGIFISMVINLILQILTWIAYVKIDKRDDKGWRIFLLVIGILWLIVSVPATIGGLLSGASAIILIESVLNLVSGVFFILAFVVK